MGSPSLRERLAMAHLCQRRSGGSAWGGHDRVLRHGIPIGTGPQLYTPARPTLRTFAPGDLVQVVLDLGVVVIDRVVEDRGHQGRCSLFLAACGSFVRWRVRRATSPHRWVRAGLVVLDDVDPGQIVDWSHPETGRVGQCGRRPDGSWWQEPEDGAVLLGVGPVVWTVDDLEVAP